MSAGLTPKEIEKELLGLTQNHYWDPGMGFGFLKGEKFEETLSRFLPTKTSVMKYPIHIATFNINKRRTEIFQTGSLARIVRASCAMPLFFHPVRIGRDLCWDGGIQDKMGLSQVADTEQVLGHSLKLGSLTDWFEFKKQDSSPRRHFLEIAKLPPTGPKNFANAPKAIQIAYEQTKRFLDAEV
jgi:NTE family protein